MKNQKGFIQTPILIAIIAGVLVLGGVGYVGIKKYENYQTEKMAREREVQELAEAQKKAFEEAQVEIEKLKQESETSKEKQKQLEQKISSQKQPDNLTISATELKPYLSAVLHIKCFGNNYTSSGSGTLWKWNNSYAVLTNDHVILEDGNDDCVASWPLDEAQDWQRGDFFWIDSKTDLDWNNETDTRVALILNKEKSINNFPVANANYSLYSLRRCPTKLPLGSPVVVIGYPASTQTDTNSPRTLTDGVISGHDQSVQPPQGVLPYTDYFVSNKIDSGNSGGVALSKDSTGLCVLGLPTWLKFGKYSAQGIVQNIHNVLHKY